MTPSPRDHHGQPMGHRGRHPDELHIGDTITWTDGDTEHTGTIHGREGQPYVEVWRVGDPWTASIRVYRHQIRHHKPGAWTPPTLAGPERPDTTLDRLREALLEHDWDTAVQRLQITPEDALRCWDQIVREEAEAG